MKSCKPEALRSFLLALVLASAAAGPWTACSRDKDPSSLPVLSDPGAGLTLTLPPSATSFARQAAAKDRFVSRVPYAPNQTLLYLHAYSPPPVATNIPPVFHEEVVECILRDELGSFLSLETSFTNLLDQTPALLLYGRARDPDKVVGFAFQCNKTHFVFIGLSGPDLSAADVAAFFRTTAANLHVADIPQATFADAAQYRDCLVDNDDPAQSLNYIRNVFASRNANPLNYTLAIGLAYRLAYDLQAADPASLHFSETLALLNNMSAIRLADFLKARYDFEIACGQRNAAEAIGQARFLSELSFPFDAEGRSLDKQRLRKAHALQ